MDDNQQNQTPALYGDEGGFPDVGEDNQPTPAGEKRKEYQNTLYSTDSLTTCTGFVNEIKQHKQGEDVMFFVRVGLIQGSKKDEQTGDWVGDITNCDLLIGSTLRKFAENMVGENPLPGMKMKFAIKNLKFTAGIHNQKPVLNSRGILETIEFGHLD